MAHASGVLAVLIMAPLTGAACGYSGSARNATAADLYPRAEWVRVDAVPFIKQTERADCGAAALAMTFAYWGLPVPRSQIAAALQSPSAHGMRAGDLRRLARDKGFQAFVIDGRLKDLAHELARQRPVVVGLMKRYHRRMYPHYEVVVGIDRESRRVLTLDPAHGMRINSAVGFAEEWAAAHQVALVMFK